MEPPYIPSGPSFVIIKMNNGNSFRNMSPYDIRDGVDSAAGGEVLQAKAIRSGALLVKVRNSLQAEFLLGARVLKGKDIMVAMADNLNRASGTVYAPELSEESPETILRESRDQGVVSVTRFQKLTKKGRPSPLLKVTFARTTIPQHFWAGYVRYRVEPYTNLPARCVRCQAYGHTVKKCKARRERCGRCAELHPSDGCIAPLKCASCKGAHASNDRDCPSWIQARQLEEAKAPQYDTPWDVPEAWPPLNYYRQSARRRNSAWGPNSAPRAPPNARGHLVDHISNSATQYHEEGGDMEQSPANVPPPVEALRTDLDGALPSPLEDTAASTQTVAAVLAPCGDQMDDTQAASAAAVASHKAELVTGRAAQPSEPSPMTRKAAHPSEPSTSPRIREGEVASGSVEYDTRPVSVDTAPPAADSKATQEGTLPNAESAVMLTKSDAGAHTNAGPSTVLADQTVQWADAHNTEPPIVSSDRTPSSSVALSDQAVQPPDVLQLRDDVVQTDESHLDAVTQDLRSPQIEHRAVLASSGVEQKSESVETTERSLSPSNLSESRHSSDSDSDIEGFAMDGKTPMPRRSTRLAHI